MIHTAFLAILTILVALSPVRSDADSWSFAGTNEGFLMGTSIGIAPFLLPDGRLLVVGLDLGQNSFSIRLFDPATRTWTEGAASPSGIGEMALLADGRLFSAGGTSASAAIYDPIADTWTPVASMGTARRSPSVTPLLDGRVLVVGGDGTSGAEVYDPATDMWTPTGAIPERFDHSATRLSDGRVLIAGGANDIEETMDTGFVYDPATNDWTPTLPMSAPRQDHRGFLLPDGTVIVSPGSEGLAAVDRYDPVSNSWSAGSLPPVALRGPGAEMLADGRMLVVGGAVSLATPPFFSFSKAAQIYDPTSDSWSGAAPVPNAIAFLGRAQRLADGRIAVVGFSEIVSVQIYDPVADAWAAPEALGRSSVLHTASRLADGRVLVAGGMSAEALTSVADARLYDPSSNSWSSAATMAAARQSHQATTLDDGRVLVTGGVDDGDARACELYDPSTDQWSPAASMATARAEHSATRLLDGRVLVAGGRDTVATSAAELYDPAADIWSPAASLETARYGHAALLLADGRVLVVGGRDAAVLASAEIYDPAANTWTTVDAMHTARFEPTATRLADGRVLVTGNNDGAATASVEVYDPDGDVWSDVAGLSEARSDHAAIGLANGEVLVSGGGGEDGLPLDDCELYDPATDNWRAAAPVLLTGFYPTLTLLADGSVLSVGGEVGGIPLARAERYSPVEGACPMLPDNACSVAAKSSFFLKRSTDARRNRLTWKWSKGAEALSQADFGDPVLGVSGYALCVYDESGGVPTLAFALDVAPGGMCGKKPCWKAVSDRGYAYKNRDGNADGVTKVAFKGGVAGKPMMQLAGKGASLPLPEPVDGVTYFETDAAVTVQVHRDEDGRCWTSRFAAASVRKNEPAQFKAINR